MPLLHDPPIMSQTARNRGSLIGFQPSPGIPFAASLYLALSEMPQNGSYCARSEARETPLGDSMGYESLVSRVFLGLYAYGLGLEALQRRTLTPRRPKTSISTSGICREHGKSS